MASKVCQILSFLFYIYITLNSPSLVVVGQVVGQECPYPCYPPPTGSGSSGGGGGNNPPSNTYSPPSQTGNYPPPSTIFPYNPPNPNYYGGGPPPPDPIVSWFPFYFKKPPHGPNQASLAGGRIQSSVLIFLSQLLVFSFLLLVL